MKRMQHGTLYCQKKKKSKDLGERKNIGSINGVAIAFVTSYFERKLVSCHAVSECCKCFISKRIGGNLSEETLADK